MIKIYIILVLLLCCSALVFSALVWPGWALELIESNGSTVEATDEATDTNTGADESADADTDTDTDTGADESADESTDASSMYTVHSNRKIMLNQSDMDNVEDASELDIFTQSFNSLTDDEKNAQLLDYCKEKCSKVENCQGFNLNRSNKTCWFKSTNSTDLFEEDDTMDFYSKN
jgi:hypothetical protein